MRLKHTVAKTWSNIDVALKQRHDELPKLVAVRKQYMQYEQEPLERVVRARGDVFSAQTRGALRGLGQLFALAENYPGLKANQSFQQLSQRISQLEDTIADRRELYNESANLNHIRLQQVPDLFVARLLAFKPRDLLEFRDARQDVDIAKLFV